METKVMEQHAPIHIRSIKLNFFLNTLRKIFAYLFPLLVFPYINRVLGPGYIGKVKFAESIVNYFVLFTSVGIPTYGLREIARIRDDPERRSKTVWELTWILAVTVAIGYILYFTLISSVSRFKKEYLLFLLVSPTILFSDFSYEWFYQGVEDQVYITIRYLIVKGLQLICIFLFVKAPEHYYRYALVGVGMNSLSTVFNVVHLRKYITYIPRRKLEFGRHLKTLSVIFMSSLAASVYTQLDVTMLGFMVGDDAIGYYSTANTIVRMIIVAVTALGEVTSPRIENCLKKGDIVSYHKYLNISLNYILIISVPCCFGIVALAPDVILLFAGKQFLPSIYSIRLLSPIIIIVGLAYFLGFQVLYPLRQEWKYTVSVSVAAICNACSNYFLISKYQQNGAIIGTIIAESIGLILQLWFTRKYIKETHLFSINTCKYFLAGYVMFRFLKKIPLSENNLVLHCAGSIIIGATVYFLFLFIVREKTTVSVISKIMNKIKKQHYQA